MKVVAGLLISGKVVSDGLHGEKNELKGYVSRNRKQD